MKTFLVTGGAGFIGSNFLIRQIKNGNIRVINYDKLTYAGNLDTLNSIKNDPNYFFIKGDICNQELIKKTLVDSKIDSIINFAAESHVDRSIESPDDFIQTNIVGTNSLLQASLEFWQSLAESQMNLFRFLQVSTDEVYGSIESGAADETARLRPNSPYAASKAAADHLVRAYNRTYGLPTLITHGSNTYGSRQFPEKLIPLIILRALSGRSLPVYGDGKQVREWIHVDDHVSGIVTVLDQGEPGQGYNLGSGRELENIELVNTLCRLLNERYEDAANRDLSELIEFVEDRPGHDKRYFMNSSKATDSLGWQCQTDLSEGLVSVIDWYMNNQSWWESIISENYDLSRFGSLER